MSGKKIIQGLREAAEHAKASNKGVVPSRDTSDDLALSQLLELSKKATPGPWETT